ncbi:hypothetical protein [Salipiger marinus]|uniref:Uncharacterized protein n=1 Tax=Salipiger marinus TaxID=555512 RepID=A0A1G8MZX8_9RHOB|nr:hypothetical protein [Salipiger marinus]SDI73488.1 hypothetical protein SAMN04487993_100968 [Salipiger marinus]
MFAPEGYMTFKQFCDLCWQAAKIMVPETHEAVGDSQVVKRPYSEVELRRETAFFWLLVGYFHRANTSKSICSPTGLVLDVDAGFFIWLHNSGRTAEIRKVHPIRSNIDDLEEFWLLIAVGEGGTWANISNIGRVEKIKNIDFPFIRGALKAVSFKNYPAVMKSGVEEWRRRRALMREAMEEIGPFLGWQVCLRRTEAPKSAEELLALFEDGSEANAHDDEDLSLPRYQGKRPKIQALVLRTFPDGVDGLPVKVIQARIAPHFDKVPHPDTIRRALGRKK